RGEEIAAAVQEEAVAALARQLLEQIDAAVHQRDHVVAGPGPPVAVALGGLVTGQRKWRALVDEHDAGDAAAHGQMIGSGDAGDAGATDDDFRGRGAHATKNRNTTPQRPALRRKATGGTPAELLDRLDRQLAGRAQSD